jgi:hypothetical protein
MIGLVLLVLVFSASAVALAIGTLDAGEGANGQEQPVAADEAPFIGLTRDEASALAEAEGRRWRVGREDGEWFALTDDYVVGRVTFGLDNGIVTAASIERPFEDRDDSGPRPTQEERDTGGMLAGRDAADILAAAVRQLLTVDHGFGDAPPPFTDVYVGSALGGLGGERLGPLQLERIAATINEIGATAQYVEDPDGLIQKLFENPPPGAAVITIDALPLEPDGAVVELHLWCGSLCGVFVTYQAALVDGEWTITGLVGPILMS